MRFLLVTPVFVPAYGYGGPPRVTLSLAHALQSVGHEVLVLTTTANGKTELDVPIGVETMVERVPVIYSPRRLLKSYFYSPDLLATLRKVGPSFDIGLGKGVWTYINAAASSAFAAMDIPYCLYPEGTFDSWAMRYHGARKRLYWSLIERRNGLRAAGFIAAAAGEAQQIRTLGFTQPIAIIPNAAEISENSAAPDLRPEVHFPAVEGKRILLFMARLHPKKGLERLLRAFALAHGDFPDAILVVIGSGEVLYEAQLKALAETLGIGEKVLFVGFLTGDRMISLLQHAYLYVLPSYSEAMPLSVQNALTCGTPVVISDACNMPEIVEYGAGVVLPTSFEPGALADALTRLLRHHEERDAMARQTTRLVAERYSVAAVGRRTADFCESLLHGASSAR